MGVAWMSFRDVCVGEKGQPENNIIENLYTTLWIKGIENKQRASSWLVSYYSCVSLVINNCEAYT